MRNPVAPTSSAISAVSPVVGEYAVAGGFWGSWRTRNAKASLDHGIQWMYRAGYIQNLEFAAGKHPGPYRGPHWMDSDLYKLLEAIAWVPAAEQDPAHRAFYDSTVDLLEKVQQKDGYLNSFYQTSTSERPWSDFAFGHEMYLGGHLIQAGIAGSRSLDDDRLLAIGSRFADHLRDRFGPHGLNRVDGHPGIEMALVELYRTTHKQRYLELAATFVDRRGHSSLGPGHFGLLYCQDAVPIRQMTSLDGHAVRAMYLAAGATDVAVETGDRELLEQLERLWSDLLATKTFVTGGVGSRHFHEALGDPYELSPDRAYCESCASVGKVMWAHRLYLATGEAKYPAEIERTLYNGFAASTSGDRTHFWYRNPLYQRTTLPPAPVNDLLEERVDIGTRASWYNTSCCPPNIMRMIANLDGYLSSVSDGVLQLNQIVPGVLRTRIAGLDVGIEVTTTYPADGSVHLRGVDGTVQNVGIRIPDWVETASIISGDECWDVPGGDYAEVLVGPRGSVVQLPIHPRVIQPDRRIDAVAGQVALARGPVIYAFEARDLDDPRDLHNLVVNAAGDIHESASATDEQLGPDLSVSGGAFTGSPPDIPYSSEPRFEQTKSVALRGRPYATWADRGPTAMRVWVPAPWSPGGVAVRCSLHPSATPTTDPLERNSRG